MNFHDRLKLLMHEYVRLVYHLSKSFPRDELYGVTSQIRRASLSVILNYIEGYARRKGHQCKVYSNFLDIAFGSLKESKYLLYFCKEEDYINLESYTKANALNEEIGKMLWSITNR